LTGRIVEEAQSGGRRSSPSISQDAKAILDYLKDGQKLHIDSVIEGLGLDAKTVLRFLLELELQGLVEQHPGKLFSLARL
jgi:DNA processing protein